MKTHVTILGWLFIALNAVHLLAGLLVGLVMAGVGGYAASFAQDNGGSFALIMAVITMFVLFFAALSIPGIVVGWGMLQGISWARVGGIILSVLMLFGPPFGTALGIYGLVILCNTETVAMFEKEQSMLS